MLPVSSPYAVPPSWDLQGAGNETLVRYSTARPARLSQNKIICAYPFPTAGSPNHLHGDTPILIYRVERLESAVARLRVQGWTPESGPFEIPNGPCYTFRDPTGVRLAIYENQSPEVSREFAGRIATNN